LAPDFLAGAFFAAGFAAAFFFAGTYLHLRSVVVSCTMHEKILRMKKFFLPRHQGCAYDLGFHRKIAIKIIENFPIHFGASAITVFFRDVHRRPTHANDGAVPPH
jgi:hypothetical protein